MVGHKVKQQKVVMVTGASTGLGLAIVSRLLDMGYLVVVTARSSSLARFDELPFGKSKQCLVIGLDVTDENQRQQAVKQVLDKWGRIDVLINNAGVCYRGVVEHLTEDDEHRQFEVNYQAPMAMTRLVLPTMRARRCGHIINISSTAGMVAMPTMSTYSASKFALEGASESLWYEMRPWQVNVTLIQPGFVHSPSFRHAIVVDKANDSIKNESDPYHRYYVNMLRLIERLMFKSPTTPDDIALRVLREIRKPGRLRVYVTWDARVFNVLRRILPQRLYHWVLYRGLPKIKEWVQP